MLETYLYTLSFNDLSMLFHYFQVDNIPELVARLSQGTMKTMKSMKTVKTCENCTKCSFDETLFTPNIIIDFNKLLNSYSNTISKLLKPIQKRLVIVLSLSIIDNMFQCRDIKKQNIAIIENLIGIRKIGNMNFGSLLKNLKGYSKSFIFWFSLILMIVSISFYINDHSVVDHFKQHGISAIVTSARAEFDQLKLDRSGLEPIIDIAQKGVQWIVDIFQAHPSPELAELNASVTNLLSSATSEVVNVPNQHQLQTFTTSIIDHVIDGSTDMINTWTDYIINNVKSIDFYKELSTRDQNVFIELVKKYTLQHVKNFALRSVRSSIDLLLVGGSVISIGVNAVYNFDKLFIKFLQKHSVIRNVFNMFSINSLLGVISSSVYWWYMSPQTSYLNQIILKYTVQDFIPSAIEMVTGSENFTENVSFAWSVLYYYFPFYILMFIYFASIWYRSDPYPRLEKKLKKQKEQKKLKHKKKLKEKD